MTDDDFGVPESCELAVFFITKVFKVVFEVGVNNVEFEVPVCGLVVALLLTGVLEVVLECIVVNVVFEDTNKIRFTD